jgi:uncharacterized membrane protein
MNKTLNNNQIALDKMTSIVYNTDMTNNNTNTNNNRSLKGTTDMINVSHDVRVIKHIDGAYDVYANFTTVQDALDYMRRMNFANDSWYIVDANDNRLRMDDSGKLVVFNSLIGY